MNVLVAIFATVGRMARPAWIRAPAAQVVGHVHALVSPEPAAQLAALRIIVPAMILLCPETRHGPRIAAGPTALRVAPEGLQWFVTHVPITPGVATFAQAACAFAALCALVGMWSRPALAVMTIAAFYLFAISQLTGAVWHDMHLLWMSALLAASPCDEALAYDRRGEPAREDSTRYGLPLLFARLLLGCIYFFPGFHKVATSGLDWALSDNLRNQMWWKWAEHGRAGTLRVDRVPGLLQAGGLFVLAFELSFPFLVLSRRARPWLAVAGVVFHLLAGALFRIPFVSLWALYVVLVDPRRIRHLPPAAAVARWADAARATLARLATGPAARPVRRDREHAHDLLSGAAGPPPAAKVLTIAVGTVLVAGAFVQGARGQMRAYPFACYPTFQWMVGTEMPDLVVEIETADGRRVALPHARDSTGYRTQRQWGEIWSLAGVTGPVSADRLRAYLEEVRRFEPARSLAAGAVRARFYRGHVSVVPHQSGRPDAVPRSDVLLLELPLTPS
jgi:hypothetical protein